MLAAPWFITGLLISLSQQPRRGWIVATKYLASFITFLYRKVTKRIVSANGSARRNRHCSSSSYPSPWLQGEGTVAWVCCLLGSALIYNYMVVGFLFGGLFWLCNSLVLQYWGGFCSFFIRWHETKGVCEYFVRWWIYVKINIDDFILTDFVVVLYNHKILKSHNI